MLNSAVLVLNRHYLPIDVTSLKRAFVMLYSGIVKAVDEQYRTFDFESWSELSVAAHAESIGVVGKLIRVPRVVTLTTFDRMPRRTVRFSRMNILLRDRHICQYCGVRYSRSNLNLDHVTPRAHGGKTTWENIVTSCLRCNRVKGGRSPEQAHMRLIRRPFRPNAVPFLGMATSRSFREEWKPFINIVDFSYWNVELEP
ncbi:MAG: HNH endonuclease [Deltaproteobacteria bacterium]|nr:HNH endonuclease [Deltaproteobacteria bacterium]